MHIVVSWDIHADDDRQYKELADALKACLSGFSWVKPLTTLYIVNIDDDEDRQHIREQLVEVCRQHRGKVNVIISPPMEGGSYSGWLPKRLWPKIRLRTGSEP